MQAWVDWFSSNYKKLAVHYNASLDFPPFMNATRNFFYDTIGSTRTISNVNFFALDFNTTYEDGQSDTTIIVGTRGYRGAKSPCGMCLSSCSAQTVYVTSEVFCDYHGSAAKSQCRVHRIRQMPQPPLPSGETIFSFKRFGSSVAYNALRFFPEVGRTRGATFSEYFVDNPATLFGNQMGFRENLWCTLPTDLFADRISLLLNTFLDASIGPQTIIGVELTDKSKLLNTTTVMSIPLPAQYALDPLWMTIYFLSTAVMLLAAVASLLLRCFISAPQILGLVGSLARDSSYFSNTTPGWTSTESGEEISKRLRDVKVGVLDVKSDKDVGRIAFAPVEMGNQVHRRRWYE